MTTLWLSALTILVLLQGYMIKNIIQDIKNLESWKILSQIKIPKDDGKGGNDETD